MSTDTSEIEEEIAKRLDETNPVALQQIHQIVQQLGVRQALEFLEQTVAIEDAGGEFYTKNGEKHRRTAGGIYFHIIRGNISKVDHDAIWPEHNYPFKYKKPKNQPPTKRPYTPRDNRQESNRYQQREHRTPPRQDYSKRQPSSWAGEQQKVLADNPLRGNATTVSITLVGRPGKVIERDKFIITPITNNEHPHLPRGLPIPPPSPTIYLVYISRVQWENVQEAMSDPDDKLVIEGYPFYDKKLAVVSVLAIDTTTLSLKQALEELL